ncbi:hypothetical protein BN8_02168 [Fibrisoma limi BUZ 3]|uniref:DUF5009 domain-containing protein n=1 Tax=Fibrisoma limi BUZ 3 TaxID=1185876 RepID=I2GGS9_9BACT|nr:DUF5009 domain-containing protein [Fibrisoma limi]CCH53104.1 hypothetical protein BN8_02168 [Fibrisoma limi BUZ 3]
MIDQQVVASPETRRQLPEKRVHSIDIFRALTMLFMIFVNDLWTLIGIPDWLEHSPADVDFLGLADVVFPCFLFIVGMSIPFAIQGRLAKGDSYGLIIRHIVVRSVALLIMGVFTVNVPKLNPQATGISSEWFQILMVVGFFLIWNVYPRREGAMNYVIRGLQLTGVVLLVGLVIAFRGGDGNELSRMTPQWWGILGLIGWTYLTCALIFLFVHRHPLGSVLAWVVFTFVCIAGHAGWLRQLWPDGPSNWILGNGAFQSFTMAGVLATLLLNRCQNAQRPWQLPLLFSGLGVLLLLAELVSRQFFIISKIQATPTWILLCSGIACLVFAGVYVLVDIKGKAHWFNPIRPAGTSTLTCYLIPYVYYSVATLSGMSLPDWLTVGVVGLLKSMVFAFLIIGITAVLGKAGIKLKL